MDIQTQKLMMSAAGGELSDPIYIDSFFKVFLYTGNNSYPRSINNGMDLAGLGGLTFHKTRSNNNYGWVVYDTENGAGAKSLRLDGTGGLDNGAVGPYALVDQFLSDGYRLNQPSSIDVLNGSGLATASFTFLHQPGFFTLKTYNGSANAQTISHQLQSVPGLILIKKTSGTGNWTVYHDSLGPTKRLEISSNDEDTGVWNNTRPTSSNFYLTGDNDAVNKASESYIAYIWSGSENDNLIFGAARNQSCVETGSYTGNGSATGPVITLRGGWAPQFVLIKNASSNNTNWLLFDTTRGISNTGYCEYLYPDLPNAPNSATGIVLTSTGFEVEVSNTNLNGSGDTHVYLAIRSSMI
jgi:hypothetical protein